MAWQERWVCASQYTCNHSKVFRSIASHGLLLPLDDAKAGCSLPVLVTNRLYVSRGVETLRERENVEHDRQASTRVDTLSHVPRRCVDFLSLMRVISTPSGLVPPLVVSLIVFLGTKYVWTALTGLSLLPPPFLRAN